MPSLSQATQPGRAVTAPPTFDEMLATISDITGRDLRLATADQLLADIGFDSLAMVEAIEMLDATGAEIHDDLISGIRTVGDLHHYLHALADPERACRPRAYSILEGPNVALRPVSQADYDWLFRLATAGTHLVRYRLRAMTPAPDSFHRFLWDKVLAQFVVSTRDAKAGWVTCFEPDFRNRYAYLAAVADPDRDGDGMVIEGMAVLISYLFAQFDLRKLYLESLECNYAQFASGESRVFEIEGRLRGHEYIDGAYQDYLLAAIWRDPWRDHHKRIFGSEAPY